ncbi:hypothetical protein V8E54_008029 [Elaphomyces granulatus]
MERRSAQDGEASAVTIATLDSSFLQFPDEYRCNIYKQAGIISPQPISDLKEWMDDRNLQLDPKLFYTSNKEVLADALSTFWSENKFELPGGDLHTLSSLGTPVMWSSLRYLKVYFIVSDSLKYYNVISCWRQVCVDLGAHLLPSRLTLDLQFIHTRSAVASVGAPCQDRTALAKDALRSMQKLPLLANLTINIGLADFRGLGFHRMASNTLKNLTCPSTERRSSFRFMDLPREIQLMVLKYTDLVAPGGPVVVSKLQGYILEDCLRRCPGECCAIYDSSQSCSRYDSPNLKGCCWSLPADLFLVSRYISMMSSQVFFSQNKFVIDVRHSGPAPPIWTLTDSGCDPSPQPGVWYPEHSKFLHSIPPACIPMLRSLTWRFHFGMIAMGRTIHVPLSHHELGPDWINMIDFMSQNVEMLSGLTITLEMVGGQFDDEVMVPLQKLKGLRDLFVHLFNSQRIRVRAVEELRLERLVMGEGYHPTKEELEARDAEMF